MAFVQNTGTNFTLYYNVLNYFKTIMKNHPSLASANYGDMSTFDTFQFPDYPLGNINIIDTTFGTNVTNYKVQLTVADKIKNRNNESSGSHNNQTIAFYGVNDEVDIHANTLAILNDLTAYTQRGVQGFDIDDDITCTPFSDQFNNGLAGWVSTFTLTTHNDKNRCLFFLVNPSGSGYLIKECDTGEEYYAVTNLSASVGQVFSSITKPNTWPHDYQYDYLQCFEVLEAVSDFDDWNFVNLPILALPVENYLSCDLCERWIHTKTWNSEPGKWGAPPLAEFRQWRFV